MGWIRDRKSGRVRTHGPGKNSTLLIVLKLNNLLRNKSTTKIEVAYVDSLSSSQINQWHNYSGVEGQLSMGATAQWPQNRQWRGDGVGRVRKAQVALSAEAQSSRQKKTKIIFPLGPYSENYMTSGYQTLRFIATLAN